MSATVSRSLNHVVRLFKRILSQPPQVPPTVSWLLEHRIARAGQSALTNGRTPTASLYRMYEYLVIGFTIGLRTEIEFFFNQPSWAVSAIPDPQDADPQRYAILSVLPYYLCKAFNRLIERGLPRGSPAIIAGDEVERELRARPIVLEEEPEWVLKVPSLAETLVIPRRQGEDPEEKYISERFRSKNIIVEEPHVLFV
ncbi:hypothetical protein GQX73_g8557 [Xylaria multiplex]|uniref:Uncharacterized protein n=1 Tax=Xylaria multiplex TaxID=323545 RepID=A0A7C8IMA1_9PEZI|nr:hypothetical protein GQX73_g8557 [Xylaria multiplex]